MKIFRLEDLNLLLTELPFLISEELLQCLQKDSVTTLADFLRVTHVLQDISALQAYDEPLSKELAIFSKYLQQHLDEEFRNSLMQILDDNNMPPPPMGLFPPTLED